HTSDSQNISPSFVYCCTTVWSIAGLRSFGLRHSRQISHSLSHTHRLSHTRTHSHTHTRTHTHTHSPCSHPFCGQGRKWYCGVEFLLGVSHSAGPIHCKRSEERRVRK